MFFEAIMSWMLSVLNLANSIIGVSVLSMPFILSKCGIVLGLFLVFVCGYLTSQSCWLLLQSGHIMHKGSYEMLGLVLFGKLGKFLMEVSNIGLLFGIVVAMFVIIGDLAPECIKVLFGLQAENSVLRKYILILMCFFVVLPLSLLRDVKKLSVAAGVSMIIYASLIAYLFSLSYKTLMFRKWILEIKYFDPSGILISVSILALAFCCQTTLFLIRDSHNDKSVPGMYSVVKAAIYAVGTIYCLIGMFGYITFHSLQEIPGDIIMAFSKTTAAFVVRLLFAATVILSIPLCVFACRTSVDSLVVGCFTSPSKQPVINALPQIPRSRFICITVLIVISALFIAIYIPNVELVLQLTGATMGSCVAFIFPSGYYLKASKANAPKRSFAGFLLVFGMFILIISTSVTVMNSDTHEPVVGEEIPAIVTEETPTTAPSSETVSETTLKPPETDQPQSDIDRGGEKEAVRIKETPPTASKPTTSTELKVNSTKKVQMKEGSRQEPPVPEDESQDKTEAKEDKKSDEQSSEEKKSKGGKDGEVVVLKPEQQREIMEKLDEMQDRIETLEKEKQEKNEEEVADKTTHEKTAANPKVETDTKVRTEILAKKAAGDSFDNHTSKSAPEDMPPQDPMGDRKDSVKHIPEANLAQKDVSSKPIPSSEDKMLKADGDEKETKVLQLTKQDEVEKQEKSTDAKVDRSEKDSGALR